MNDLTKRLVFIGFIFSGVMILLAYKHHENKKLQQHKAKLIEKLIDKKCKPDFDESA